MMLIGQSHKERYEMNLDRITITGADDSIDPQDLVAITKKYPFVEWGILFSRSQQGTSRFPSNQWVKNLMKVYPNFNLSAHLCGKWVRDVVLKSEFTFRDTHPLIANFQRIQLNFHGQYHKAHPDFVKLLHKHSQYDWIFQHDGVNDELIIQFVNMSGINVFPLFDRSGGAGVVPSEWPKPICGYQGYAGGLGPDNIVNEIGRVSQVAGESKVWIDMETKVRSNNDMQFELSKVEQCLELSKPFVK